VRSTSQEREIVLSFIASFCRITNGNADGDPSFAYIGRWLSVQMEIWKTGYIEVLIKEPPKGYYNPLRGFTTVSSDNPTFSFHAPEG